MTPQPIGVCDEITIFENINHRKTLEVDDLRPVGLRLSPTPISDPDDPRGWWTNLSRAQHLPENCIVADLDTQPSQEPFSKAAASGVRHVSQELRLFRRAPRIRCSPRNLVIGERAEAAIRVQRSLSTNTEIDPNRLALSGKVLDLPPLPTMSLP